MPWKHWRHLQHFLKLIIQPPNRGVITKFVGCLTLISMAVLADRTNDYFVSALKLKKVTAETIISTSSNNGSNWQSCGSADDFFLFDSTSAHSTKSSAAEVQALNYLKDKSSSHLSLENYPVIKSFYCLQYNTANLRPNRNIIFFRWYYSQS